MAIKIIPNTETVPIKLDSDGRLVNKEGAVVDLVKTAPNLVMIDEEKGLVDKEGKTVGALAGSTQDAFLQHSLFVASF